MFLDFALISGLLVIAHLLRTWVRFFQTIFLPTPILAGLIGLAAGPEGLDLIPFARDEAGVPVMRQYPGELVVLPAVLVPETGAVVLRAHHPDAAGATADRGRIARSRACRSRAHGTVRRRNRRCGRARRNT